MVQAIHLVREGNADALVSCGNTSTDGRRHPMASTNGGYRRPALGTIIPTKKIHELIDVGANPESTQNLVHNAILGSNYVNQH